MKRFVYSTVTMSHSDKFKVMEWLDLAERAINKFCKAKSNDQYFYEIDDVSWGSDCISVPVWKGSRTNRKDYKLVQKFTFGYDADDVFGRSEEEQLADKLDEFIDSLNYLI